MEKEPRKARKKRGGLLVPFLLLLILAAIGWQLRSLQEQLRSAQVENERTAQQVESLQQENDSLRADIEEGPTEEKMKELARNELGMIEGDSYLFIDK